MTTKKRFFLSLRVKVILLLLAAFLLAWLSYVGTQTVSYQLINDQYMSVVAINRRMDNYLISLQSYVTKHNLSSADFEELEGWNQENDVYLMVYNSNNELLFESAYWEDEVAAGITYETDEEAAATTKEVAKSELVEEDSGEEEIGAESNVQPMSAIENLRPVEFANGKAMVSLIDYSDLMMFYLADTIAIIVAALCFAICVIWFNHRTTKKILRLGAEVRAVEDGNLENEITIQGRDELSILSRDINNMRKSIVTRLQNEQEAWQANCELITAMSHDIRTPLTALLGYLDIIEGKKYQSQEQFDRYVHSSKQKALQLKELSDKLFQYFVVFGNEEQPLECVSFDAVQLISQILGEQVLYLHSEGFTIEADLLEESCAVSVELGMIRRVFDNCLSNIKKYADHNEPIHFTVTQGDEQVLVQIRNTVKAEAIGVESTKIGLKSCEKMMQQMGGSFCYQQEAPNSFCVAIGMKTSGEPRH